MSRIINELATTLAKENSFTQASHTLVKCNLAQSFVNRFTHLLKPEERPRFKDLGYLVCLTHPQDYVTDLEPEQQELLKFNNFLLSVGFYTEVMWANLFRTSGFIKKLYPDFKASHYEPMLEPLFQ